MNENIQCTTEKHPLARAREILGIGQKQALEYLGIPQASCAHIESGRTNDGKPYPFTPKCVARVSAWTGIAPACLLSKTPNVKLLTTSGEPFTKATYARLAAERDDVINPSMKSGNETFRFFLLLIAKLGRLLLAAKTDSKPRPDIVWQLRSEMVKLGSTLPAWESKEIAHGVVKSPTLPEQFDSGIQGLLARYNGNRLPMPKLGEAILQDFDRCLYLIEWTKHKAAKQPATKPTAKTTNRKPARSRH